MSMRYSAFVFTLLVLTMTVSSSFAQEDDHSDCGGNSSIKVKKMGDVNERQLQEHISEVESNLKKLLRRHARGSHLSASATMRFHLADMREAMQSLHDQMYLAGCSEAKHGTSLETRVEVLEQRLSVTQ